MQEVAPFFSIDGPLFIPSPYGTIRGAHFFLGIKTLVHNLGGDWLEVLARHGVDPSAAEDADYPLSCTTGGSILEYCSRRFNDRQFGLHLADCQDADVYGCLTTLARTAPNLGRALESMVEYMPVLHCPGSSPELTIASETAEFRWRPYADIGFDEQSISHGLLLIDKFIQTLAGCDFRKRYVNTIANVSRKNIDGMERRFHCKVNVNASANAIGFNVEYLSRPIKTSNGILFGLLKSYLSQVKNATKPTLVIRVEAYVKNELSRGCSVKRCAAQLGTAPRTLARNLAERGITFSDIVEEQRRKTAIRALLETDRSLDEIANSLGYSEQSSFGRAFRRWTNMTPQAYRDSKASRRPSSIHAINTPAASAAR